MRRVSRLFDKVRTKRVRSSTRYGTSSLRPSRRASWRCLIERVDIDADGLNVRFRVDRLNGLECEMANGSDVARGMNRPVRIPDMVTLHVPFRIVKRGGWKEMRLPDGASLPRLADNALVKALARAFRWKRMLESGEFATIGELAQRGGIAVSYMTRVLRLTLLAPDIVEAILDGGQPEGLRPKNLVKGFAVEWAGQRTHLG
jgi:hypothetical protein